MEERPSPEDGETSEAPESKPYIPNWQAAPLTAAEIRKLPPIDEFPQREKSSRKGPELMDPDVYLDSEESEPDPFLPSDEELPAMQAWKEQNKEELSRLTKRKRGIALHDALQELRARRAREKIAAISPDDPEGVSHPEDDPQP